MGYQYQVNFEPVTGCTQSSPGCRNCYMVEASEELKKLGNPRYKNGFNLTIHESEITKFLAFSKKSARVSICLSSDLFHEDVPDRFILDALESSNQYSWQHGYLLLTKRSEHLLKISQNPRIKGMFTKRYVVGVSVETPEQYYRIKHLQQVKCHFRWLSLAPFLVPLPDLPLEGIHNVVLSLEEGPMAKPVDDHAIDDVRRQCLAAGVGFCIFPLGRDMVFVREADRVTVGSVGQYLEAMIFQLVERTGGLQVIPLPGHPRYMEFLEQRKKVHHLSNLELVDLVRQVAPEFFED